MCALNFHMNRIVIALIQTLFTTLIVKYTCTMSSITGFVILLSKLNGYDKKKTPLNLKPLQNSIQTDKRVLVLIKLLPQSTI